MPRFFLTNRAKIDLKEIGRYTLEKYGPEQRNKYLRMLDSAFYQIANHELVTVDCSYIRTGYRKYHIGRHVIFFRETQSGITEITRVLHERMDFENRLGS